MISNQPLVTIVTPSYNQGRFIKATIESVLTQDYPYVEYIIVDGASTDETAELVRPYERWLRFISEPDRGQTHAVNKGFALARGEIVAWLNSDDLFLPGAIGRAVEAFKAKPTAGVAYGGGFEIDEAGAIKQRFPFTQHFDLWKFIFTSNYILNQSAFFRKAALDAVGPLREELYYIMDWEILMRLGLYFDFAYIPEDMSCLREYGTTKTFTGGQQRVAEIRKILYEYTGQRFPPGVIVYGLDAYQQLWNAQIDSWPVWLNFAKRPAHKIVTKPAHTMIEWAGNRGQAWWRDMWMGPSAYTMLPQGRGEVVMRGMVPPIPGLERQIVRIRYRGRVIHEAVLGPGQFELRFRPPFREEQSPIFHIQSSERFTFAKAASSDDERVLSLRMTDFRWSEPG
jgi:glycosyltransferase involved in cell wall biosynthesis